MKPFTTWTQESLKKLCDQDISFTIRYCKIVTDYSGDTPKYKLYRNSDVILLIKLLIETKPIVCLPWEILHYKI